jgi:Tfp pilus assembly protein PilO
MSNKRAPILAAIAAAVVALLAVLFLVLPKRNEVSEARAQLESVRQQTTQLNAQLAALNAAKANAPQARAEIRAVDNQLPPTLDESGILLLLKNSVERSGIEFADIAVSSPTLGSTGEFSIIPVTITLDGSYFSLASFLNRIETFPRAAKVLSGSTTVSTAPSSPSTIPLTMQLSMELYTSDVSAGPGSEPGPTREASGA